MSAKDIVNEIIQLDTKIAELRDKFDALPGKERSDALRSLCEDELRSTGTDDPVPMSLVRAADMICALEEDAAEILAPGLDHPSVDVRQLTGEALLTLAEDGVYQILPAVDMALEAGTPAGEEMPFILAMIDDPEAPKQIERFLAAKSADMVVAAIEALAEVGDPDSLPALEKLFNDERKIAIDEDDQAVQEITIGRLAKEAVEMIDAHKE